MGATTEGNSRRRSFKCYEGTWPPIDASSATLASLALDENCSREPKHWQYAVRRVVMVV